MGGKENEVKNSWGKLLMHYLFKFWRVFLHSTDWICNFNFYNGQKNSKLSLGAIKKVLVTFFGRNRLIICCCLVIINTSSYQDTNDDSSKCNSLIISLPTIIFHCLCHIEREKKMFYLSSLSHRQAAQQQLNPFVIA
jgi:hypothetical protein